uniref:IclR family transcriptional regulator n=1 Tax=Rhabditophanes sp. KR3021 TaxID=114890 RepID=A0AC35UFW6_9BILA
GITSETLKPLASLLAARMDSGNTLAQRTTSLR